MKNTEKKLNIAKDALERACRAGQYARVKTVELDDGHDLTFTFNTKEESSKFYLALSQCRSALRLIELMELDDDH